MVKINTEMLPTKKIYSKSCVNEIYYFFQLNQNMKLFDCLVRDYCDSTRFYPPLKRVYHCQIDPIEYYQQNPGLVTFLIVRKAT